jgi:hypothetical protein
MPHRSPSATVNVMSLNNVVAPNSTDAFETDMRVNFDSCFDVVTSRNVNHVFAWLAAWLATLSAT